MKPASSTLECPICRDIAASEDNYFIITDCGHFFHANCIKINLSQSESR